MTPPTTELRAALTEARRVLRIAEWGKRWCRVCHKFQDEGHAPGCALAAVLAQEEKS
jgi:hypothetical protein